MSPGWETVLVVVLVVVTALVPYLSSGPGEDDAPGDGAADAGSPGQGPR